MQNPTIIRTQTMVAFVTGVVLTLIASAIIFSAWSADAATTDPGDVYVAIDPTRAYDGRIDSYAESGRLAPGASKTISVKDGHDLTGNLVAQNAVPAGATSITYNLTIAGPTGPNFVAVTPGDSTSFLSSAINFKTSSIANAGNVKIDANRQIKVWGGGNTGSMFVIIDITGYYLPKTTTGGGNTDTPPTVASQLWKVEFAGSLPGVEDNTKNDWDRVTFGLSSGDVAGTPGTNGNDSDSDDSCAKGTVIKPTDTMIVTVASSFPDGCDGTPSNPKTVWELTSHSYDPATGIITGTYKQTLGSAPLYEGTFQMIDANQNFPTPLPDPVFPTYPAGVSGPACSTSPDFSTTTWELDLTGTVPGVAPAFNPLDVRFAVTNGAITDAQAQRYDQTNPPWTYPTGTVICGDREVTITLHNNSTPNPPTPQSGRLFLQNVATNNAGGFIGDYQSRNVSGILVDQGTFTLTP
ncbi:MAG: hypothetical protein ACJAR2_002769 [Ilumatobacter sp.]|jgi:hypothetical protein